MIEIRAESGRIAIGPIDRRYLDGVVDLYNCSEGYRYATGISYPVTQADIALKLDVLATSRNEFFTGIYEKEPGGGACRLIGVVSGLLYENTLWIKLIAILPQFQHQGIGSTTVELVVQWSKAVFNTSDVLLSVIEKNDEGVKFWRKLGFGETGRFTKMLFGDKSPYEVIIMHKSLQEPSGKN
jgi:GNAT superfamily N-acetyltransferase